MPTQPPKKPKSIDFNSPSQPISPNEQQPARKIKRAAYHSDRKFYHVVVWFLGVTMIVCTVGAIGLSVYDKDIPDIIVAIGSAAIGALAGVFATNSQR